MKRKVALIYMSNYFDWPMGGMLNYIKNMIPYLCNHEDWELDLWGSEIDGTLENEYVNHVKINTYTNVKTKNKKIPNFLVSFFNVIRNRKFFKNYDIIYSHTSATTIALKLCYPQKFVVHHQHGLSYKDNVGFVRILNIGYTLAQLLSNISFFVASEEELQKHKKALLFRKKHFYSIGSPIDYTEIKNTSVNRSDSTLRCIYTGRMDGWKNVDLLVDSFIKYHRCNSNSVLYMVGDGPEYEHIKSKITSSGAMDYIFLPGRLDHKKIVRLLKSSDIFLFPSKGEGVSLSILEALAAGLPVVGFDVIGVRNFVIHKETGILVAEQAPDPFVDGIKMAAVFYRELSDKCVKLAEQYDSQGITKQIVGIIDREYMLIS